MRALYLQQHSFILRANQTPYNQKQAPCNSNSGTLSSFPFWIHTHTHQVALCQEIETLIIKNWLLSVHNICTKKTEEGGGGERKSETSLFFLFFKTSLILFLFYFPSSCNGTSTHCFDVLLNSSF